MRGQRSDIRVGMGSNKFEPQSWITEMTQRWPWRSVIQQRLVNQWRSVNQQILVKKTFTPWHNPIHTVLTLRTNPDLNMWLEHKKCAYTQPQPHNWCSILLRQLHINPMAEDKPPLVWDHNHHHTCSYTCLMWSWNTSTCRGIPWTWLGVCFGTRQDWGVKDITLQPIRLVLCEKTI